MGVLFRFLGFAAFELTTDDNKKILIDPYINDNPVSPIKSKDLTRVDLILVSHGAFDHLGDTAVIAKEFNCPVICGGDSKMLLMEQGVDHNKIIETTWGLTVQANGIKVRPVESRHRSAVKLKNGNVVSALPLGFLIYINEKTRIYNSSDTCLFSDMKLIGELYRPQIGLLNVTIENCFDFLPDFLTGEMTPYEAALAAQWLNLEYAVACHYTNPDNEEVRLFGELVKNMNPNISPILLKPGDTFTYSAK